jgi:hypothetical protein
MGYAKSFERVILTNKITSAILIWMMNIDRFFFIPFLNVRYWPRLCENAESMTPYRKPTPPEARRAIIGILGRVRQLLFR